MINRGGPEENLPKNIEAEQAVLGGILIDGGAIEAVADFLKPEHFHLPPNAAIYNAMIELYGKGVAIDLVTVTESMGETRLENAGGLAYLASLATMTPTSMNTKHYGEICFRLALKRLLIELLDQGAKLALDEDKDAPEAIVWIEQQLFNLTNEHERKDFEHIAAIMQRALERIAHLREIGSELTGISTGYLDLDKRTHGFQRKDLIYIAARPALGKTALCLNMAWKMATKGIQVGFFSIEMSADQLGERILTLDSWMPNSIIRSGKMPDSDWLKTSNHIAQVAGLPIFVDESKVGIAELRSKARRLQMREDIQIIFVDYIQLMLGAKSQNEAQELSSISRGLKAIAKELDVPVVAISQLNRSPEGRREHVPELADLRGSGSLEQDADLVLMLYRAGFYDPEAPDVNKVDVITAKHRNGETGVDHLQWNGEQMRFNDLDFGSTW